MAAIVGFAEKYVSGVDVSPCPVRWDAGGTTATELEGLGTDVTPFPHPRNPTAINKSGTIAGTIEAYVSGIDKGGRAVRWAASGTAVTELGNLGTDTSGATSTNANAINTTGTIVGYAQKYDAGVNMGNRAARWDAAGTAATELGSLETNAAGTTYANAFAINDAGTAVGIAEKYASGVDVGRRAVRWDASDTAATELVANLGTSASGRTDVYAGDINAAGTIVGRANKYDISGNWLGTRALRWDASGTVATELGNLGTSSSGLTIAGAGHINASGIAVGYAEKYVGPNTFQDTAVLWGLDGAAVDLNTLIDPANGWRLKEADSISDTGWIAGIGAYDPDGAGPLAAYDRFFIIQVPEPATLALVALGGLALMRRRARK